MIRYVAFAAVVLAIACTKPPAPLNPGRPASCADACDNARRLGCLDAQPTPAGALCDTVCDNVQASGITSWDLDCRAAASSCSARDACP